jgi:hypothetical protein
VAVPAPGLEGWSSFLNPQYLSGAGEYILANLGAGTVLNAGSGAVAGFAGGRGNIGGILSRALRSAERGLGQESALDLLGLVYGGLGPSGLTILPGSTDSIYQDANGNFLSAGGMDPVVIRAAKGGPVGFSIDVVKTINNSYLAPEDYNYAHGVK